MDPKDCGRIQESGACSEGDSLFLHFREFGEFPVIIPLPSTAGPSGDLADARGTGLG